MARGASIQTAPTTTRAGYTFNGRYQNDVPVIFPYVVNNNGTFAAGWTANSNTTLTVTVSNNQTLLGLVTLSDEGTPLSGGNTLMIMDVDSDDVIKAV